MQKGQASEPVSKKDCLLNPNQTSELIMDSNSIESLGNVVATGEDKYCEEVLLELHQWSWDEYTVCSSAQAPFSPDSPSTSEDDDHYQSGPDPQTQQPIESQWTLPPHLQKTEVHTFMGGPGGKNDSETSHINNSSTALSVFMLYFTETVTLPVVESNRYYHRCMDSLDNGSSPQTDVTETKIFCVSGNKNTNVIVLTWPADRLLGKNAPVLHSILHQQDEKKQIFTHHLVSTFYGQQEWSRKDGRKLR